jgi:hypothetical protein
VAHEGVMVAPGGGIERVVSFRKYFLSEQPKIKNQKKKRGSGGFFPLDVYQ